MNRLLLDPDVPAFERALLGSWTDEQPEDGARERAMALASLAAGGLAVGGVASAAGSAASAATSKAMSASALALVKWLTVGTFVAGLAAGGATYARRAARRVEGAPVAVATLRSRTAPFDPPGRRDPIAPVATEAPPAEESSTAAALALAAAPKVARARDPQAAPTAPSAPSVPSTLDEQIAAVDRARGAIAAGDGVRAAKLVDDYERRFPRGAFLHEAEVLRIEAQVLRGDLPGARLAAQRFLATHPASPHGARLRALVGTKEP